MVGVPVGIKSSVAHEISQGSDGGHDGIGDVSTELGKFACDFEKEILLPLREKRAASDEVLAIQPVASGVSEHASVKIYTNLVWHDKDTSTKYENNFNGPLSLQIRGFLEKSKPLKPSPSGARASSG